MGTSDWAAQSAPAGEAAAAPAQTWGGSSQWSFPHHNGYTVQHHNGGGPRSMAPPPQSHALAPHQTPPRLPNHAPSGPGPIPTDLQSLADTIAQATSLIQAAGFAPPSHNPSHAPLAPP